jgi:hypothetical protein
MELAPRILKILREVDGIQSVELIGSRAGGDPVPLSDWDFMVHTANFDRVSARLPASLAQLGPLAAQWDRLSSHACYMLVLEGPTKVDFLFDRPSTFEPPWEVSADTLSGIDAHFWDWTLWLAPKKQRGKSTLVASELAKMHEHLLSPMGSERIPTGLGEAVEIYRDGRARAEKQFGVQVSRHLGEEVCAGLEAHGLLAPR